MDTDGIDVRGFWAPLIAGHGPLYNTPNINKNFNLSFISYSKVYDSLYFYIKFNVLYIFICSIFNTN